MAQNNRKKSPPRPIATTLTRPAPGTAEFRRTGVPVLPMYGLMRGEEQIVKVD